MKTKGFPLILLPTLLLAALACSLGTSPVGTPAPPTATSPFQTPAGTATLRSTSPPSPKPQSTPSPMPQAQHRIGTRTMDGVAEFYDQQTGLKFVPRGANYVFVPSGEGFTHLTLKVGVYDPARTREDFSRLASLGYNTVRVFLDHCNAGLGCIGAADNQGLNPAYVDNIADMMSAAHDAGIYILFTSNDLPDQGGYAEEANSASGASFAGYRNAYYLTPPAISATRRYWRDLMTGLAARSAAFDAVLGWQLLNEQWMFADQPPLSLTDGLVETTTGTYDMSDPAQKKRMVSDGLVYYIAQMKGEILAHDPSALVTMGFFAPEIAAPGWYVETASLLERSELDFFDFHAYPGGAGLAEHVRHFGMAGYDSKPIILGEYGAFRHIYPDLQSAARAATQWAAESCEFGFDGWLYWAYYPANADIGDSTWGLADEDGTLLNLFAPANQPDICVPVQIPNDNLAYGKPVSSSMNTAENPPEMAVDDNADTLWNAGGGPVQWIQVDLGGSFRITEIRLLVSQYPAGATEHRLQVRNSAGDSFQTVFIFSGETGDGDWLAFTAQDPLEKVSQIRVQTVASPSWVAWREIVVHGEPMP